MNADGTLLAYITGTNLLVRDVSEGIDKTNGVGDYGLSFGEPRDAVFTPDSKFLLFYSRSTSLTTNPVSGFNLFARDLLNDRTHLISIGTNGAGVGVSGQICVSANSRYVAFVGNDKSIISMHDLISKTNVPYIAGGAPSLSSDGRFIAFEARDQGAFSNFFGAVVVLDRQSGAIELISKNSSGLARSARKPLISADARFVVFLSSAADLVPNDTNQLNDVFVRDRLLGTTTLISRSINGGSGNGSSSAPVMAADGRTVVFHSIAGDLVEGDYNDKRDIFILKLGGADTDGDGLDDDWEVAYFGNLSRNGSGDFDGDGQTDLQEFRAGTDPTNSDSIFRVLTVTPLGGGSTRIVWNASPGRAYRVEFKNAVTETDWTALDGTISWSGATASLTDGTAGTTARYYRVVRL